VLLVSFPIGTQWHALYEQIMQSQVLHSKVVVPYDDL
jgi:hypothetical protein